MFIIEKQNTKSQPSTFRPSSQEVAAANCETSSATFASSCCFCLIISDLRMDDSQSRLYTLLQSTVQCPIYSN